MSMTKADVQGKTLLERIVSLTEEVIENDSYFLVDIALRGFKGSRVIEIYIDGDDGVDVDVLAGISRRLGFIIESEDLIAGKYTLTVSSPGAKYAFRSPRQYGKHVGQKLDLRIGRSGADEETELVRGTLKSVSDEQLVLIGSNEEKRKINFNEITKAKVVLPW